MLGCAGMADLAAALSLEHGVPGARWGRLRREARRGARQPRARGPRRPAAMRPHSRKPSRGSSRPTRPDARARRGEREQQLPSRSQQLGGGAAGEGSGRLSRSTARRREPAGSRVGEVLLTFKCTRDRTNFRELRWWRGFNRRPAMNKDNIEGGVRKTAGQFEETVGRAFQAASPSDRLSHASRQLL